MLDFPRTGRRIDDPRELLAEISKRYPDREKCLRIFVAAVLDDQRLVQSVIKYAFDEWTSRTPQ